MSVTAMFNDWFSKHVSQPPADPVDDPREVVDAGDFKLDIGHRQAFLHGEMLTLSSAEFDLLRYLLSHRKMLVTPSTTLSTKCQALNIRRTEFMKTLLSLQKSLDAAAQGSHYLHIEPWVLYEFDLTAGGNR